MKITKEPIPDIYTRKVTVEMTEAEWEFIAGMAADLSATLVATAAVAVAAQRLTNGSKPYWEKNLDYSKLFVSDKTEKVKYPLGELNQAEKNLVNCDKHIDAIKEYRMRKCCGLADAKDAVDTYRSFK